MNKILLGTLTCAILSGCMHSQPYGNFAKDFPQFDKAIAEDSVQQLSVLFPPASTGLQLQQPSTDQFGKYMIETLRAKGYAVSEYHTDDTPLDKNKMTTAARDLMYYVDYEKDLNLLHLTLRIDDETLSRAYFVEDYKINPAGVWIRRNAQ